MIAQICPEQGGDDNSRQDHQAAHRRRPALRQEMRRRPVVANWLAFALFEAQGGDDARPKEEHEEERCRGGAAGSEGNITK